MLNSWWVAVVVVTSVFIFPASPFDVGEGVEARLGYKRRYRDTEAGNGRLKGVERSTR